MKTPSNFNYKKLDVFDGIELFEASQDIDYFPFHKHDVFCISIITKGTEVFENRNKRLIIPANTVSITQANEVHKNYSLGELGYSYKTIYVNPDLLAYFNNGETINGLEPVINDPELFYQIEDIFHKCNDIVGFGKMLKKVSRYKNNPNENKERFSIERFDYLIEQDYLKTINIDQTAKKFDLSKYHFIREFKKQTGITPIAYKLEKAKNDLKLNLRSIKDVTFDYGFYDISHFSNTFKKFYDISPSEYKTVFKK